MPPNIVTPTLLTGSGARARGALAPVVPGFAAGLVAALYDALATRDAAAFRAVFVGPEDVAALLAARDRHATKVAPHLTAPGGLDAWFMGQAAGLAPLEGPCPALAIVPRQSRAVASGVIHHLGVTFLGAPLEMGLRILEQPTRHGVFSLRASRLPPAAVGWQPVVLELHQVARALDDATSSPEALVATLDAFAERAAGPLAAAIARARADIDVAPLEDPAQPSPADVARVDAANTLAYLCEAFAHDFGVAPGQRLHALLRARRRVSDPALGARLQAASQRIEALVALPSPPPGQGLPDDDLET